MLLNNFYTINKQQSTENSVKATVTFNPEHEIFSGHFPGQPVVPGVCMVQVVKEFMQQHAGAQLLFKKGNQIKFLQLLVPDKYDTIDIQVSWTKDTDGQYLTIADFKKNGENIFKLNGVFTVRQSPQITA